MVLGIFKIALGLRDRHIFVWQPLRYLKIFWKTKTLFKNLERLFMVESAKIEKITFQYKTALWIDDVKANRLGSTNWSISTSNIASNCFIFQKLYFSLRASCKELIWCINYPNDHTHSFRKCWSFIWAYLFPVSILNAKQFPNLLSQFQTPYLMSVWYLPLGIWKMWKGR